MVFDLRKKQIANIIAESWLDKGFRERLISNPVAEISRFGMQLTEGMSLEILEDTEAHKYIVLPAPPWVVPTHLTLFPYLDKEASEAQQIMGDIVSRCWIEPDLKDRLKSNPHDCMTEAGLKLPQHVEFEIKENTANRMFLALPVSPDLAGLNEADIAALAEGTVVGVSSEKLY